MIVEIPYVGITIELDHVIYGVLAYVIGLVTVMLAQRLRRGAGREYRVNDAIVEAVVMEYTRRLKDYDRVIGEMRAKLDIIEVKGQSIAALSGRDAGVTPSQMKQPHAQPVSDRVVVTQHPQQVEVFEGQNGTTDYILKLLLEKPRTSREVQHAVGRTREHTARLLKKLHDGGLVTRDINSKPFRYNITATGQSKLRKSPQEPGLEQTV